MSTGMSASTGENLPEPLFDPDESGPEVATAVLADSPEPRGEGADCAAGGGQIDLILDWVKTLWPGSDEEAAEPPATPRCDGPATTGFVPIEPRSFRAAGLTDSMVESLALKFLLAQGDASGRQIADQIKLAFVLVEDLLRSMKNDQLLTHRGAAAMNDFVYQLTDLGRERARRHWAHGSYCGAAPVPLRDYIASVKAQSLTAQQPTPAQLQQAFADLTINARMLDRLGPAVSSGRGLFLYGAPGNGKTSIAERITRAFGQELWIPRAIGIDGEILRVFDPTGHEELPLEQPAGLYDGRAIDHRWVRIRRPTIVVGGELTFSSLEVILNTSTRVCEAPLQIKSNCGTLVIDDFGRQRVSIEELLNRWILPLEKRYDLLDMPNGKKIRVPFDQLVIFATNLDPSALVDEAFLRRIPYKIEVVDPTLEEFREVFRSAAPALGFEFRPEPIDYLIERHYRQAKRPFRYCHPRDLLLQVRSYCAYKGCPLEITPEYLDLAVENYFAIRGS
ncbi:MAG: AAA family ATPase [Thermoguttaceae bacterium]|jgi:DNA-binding PadR family transcriptional regulator